MLRHASLQDSLRSQIHKVQTSGSLDIWFAVKYLFAAIRKSDSQINKTFVTHFVGFSDSYSVAVLFMFRHSIQRFFFISPCVFKA